MEARQPDRKLIAPSFRGISAVYRTDHIIRFVDKLADRFVLEREVGSGGMARVFLGHDEVLDRTIAVKMLRPGFAGTDISDRFQREGRTSARLSHPNIVQVYDAGESPFEGREVSYIVMEYVPGGDLKQRIQSSGTLDTCEAARLVGQTARGLAHAHGRGIIHRDIKPHNILLDESGTPKLADFGIARALEATRLTKTGAFLGTAIYSSPEQLKGEKVTAKTDVYALGVTLYQALTGDPPFLGETPMDVASKHLSEIPRPPIPLSQMGQQDAEMWRIVLDCLEKSPDERPTADELSTGLDRIAREGEEQRDRHGVTTKAAASVPLHRQPKRVATRDDDTVVTPVVRRKSSRRKRNGGLVAVAVVVVMLVAGSWLLLAPSDEQTAGNVGNRVAQVEPEVRDEVVGTEDEPQTGAAPTQNQDAENQDTGTSGNERGSAVSGALESVYTSAASGDYGASYDMLSTGFRASTAPSEGQWSSQFETLQSITFVGEPEVEVSGDSATVSGVTEAVHTDRTERNTAVWTLVREDGQWKLDAISIQAQEVV